MFPENNLSMAEVDAYWTRINSIPTMVRVFVVRQDYRVLAAEYPPHLLVFSDIVVIQDRYYERVVRTARETEIFERYIRENPEKLSNPKEVFWNDKAGYWVDL